MTRFELKILLFLKKLVSQRAFNLVLWLFHPTAEFVVHKLGENISLYDCVDYLEIKSPFDGRILSILEDKLLGTVDYVFANSAFLASTKKHLRKDVKVVSCGFAEDEFPCDYHPKEKPKLLPVLDKPAVGFTGYLDYRLDYDLIKYLLVQNPDYVFVFLGAVLDKISFEDGILHKPVTLSIKELKKYPNFHLLPPISKAELIDYLHYFDVALIPYNLDFKFVYYSNPMKFYEYLAAGVPIVSVPIPSLLKYHLPAVRFARDKKVFNRQLNWLITHQKNIVPYKKKMRAIAQENSWEGKISQILKHLKFPY